MAEEEVKFEGTAYDGTPIYSLTKEQLEKSKDFEAIPEDYIIQVGSDGKEYVERDGLWYPFTDEDGPDYSVKGIPENKIS